MRIPTIEGIIARRILVNYSVDPDAIKKILPSPFKPVLVDNKAMAGICLIRLKEIRPKGMPACAGVGSENGQTKRGVYIPRRDTNSTFNHLVGGRLFPGLHYKARFAVMEEKDNYE